MLENKRILITGGSGKIGNEVIKLIPESCEIMNIDLKTLAKKHPSNYQEKLIDISRYMDINRVFEEFNPDYVIHLAAVFERTWESIYYGNNNFYSNIVGGHNVFELALKQKVERLVNASSYLVYDSNAYLHKKLENSAPLELIESSSLNPRNLVGSAKYYAEKELEYYSNFGLNSISLRISRVYGPNANDVTSRWIRDIITGSKIEIWGKNQCMDYVHCHDIASSIILSLESDKTGIYNSGYGSPTYIYQLADFITNKLSSEYDVNIDYQDDNDIDKYEKSYLSIDKMKKDFGYSPKLNIEKGLTQTIEYELGKLN